LNALTQLAQFAQQNWLTVALLAMFFASLANLTLKILVKNQSVLKINWAALVPIIVLVVIALLAGWFLFVSGSPSFKISEAQLFWIAVLVVFSLSSFACTVLALQSGKVTLVTAVLSLSTVLVAALSVAFFGEKFEPREVAALIFAVISVLLLVL
jgi:drug/metabolite transporter (DMT)-like permease